MREMKHAPSNVGCLRRYFRGATQFPRHGRAHSSRTNIRAARITGAGPVSGYGPDGLSPPPSEVHSPPCRAPWSHSSRLPLPRPVAGTPLPQRFDCVYDTTGNSPCQEDSGMFFGCFFASSFCHEEEKRGSQEILMLLSAFPQRLCARLSFQPLRFMV